MCERQALHRAYLSLGANVDPARNLRAAVEALGRFGHVRAASTVWQTAPLGFAAQPDFLNAVVLLETPLSAQALREQAIAAIERQLGRVRTANKNGPRTIDIDIMLFDHAVFELNGRHIPDIEVLERPFVALPLAEIAPDEVHPETGQTLRQIAARFDPQAENMQARKEIVLLETKR